MPSLRSHALRISFRETALLGQMVLRSFYGDRKSGKQLRLSHDLLFDVLQEHEPDQPLLSAARTQVKSHFLHVSDALLWLEKNHDIDILVPTAPPPLSLPVIVHGWVDWSVSSDPVDAIEEVYNQVMSQYEKDMKTN